MHRKEFSGQNKSNKCYGGEAVELSDKKKLVAPCGLYCAECVLFKTKDELDLMEKMVAQGISREKLPCPGCRPNMGNCPLLECSICETYLCISNRNLDFCFECNEFPCDKLNPAADKSTVLPHNIKIYNLCYMKEHGLSAWLEKSAEIQRKYFHGKMSVGKGPSI